MPRNSLLPSQSTRDAASVSVTGAVTEAQGALLNADVLDFVASLERQFGARRRQLMQARAERQARLDSGREVLDFPAETRAIRAANWSVAPIPADLEDRRVEITGPVERKMIINALNSGADTFMADFEDSYSPTWDNIIQGQVNLSEAVRRTISFTDEETGKDYRLAEKTAVLIVRPRGWHMEEVHVLVDEQPISAALFDFGVYAFHNSRELINRGTGCYLYLPKIENRFEAALWRDVFIATEEMLGLPQGTIRCTVLIETLPAAFEMDEILFELRDYITGLNCGRWDYIFSMIKTLGSSPNFIVPDRAQVTMVSPALRAYSQLLIKICHARGAHAMGGMAAQIPVKDNPEANRAAFAKVKADKDREAGDGYDGTWVAHPGLSAIARESFDAVMPGANQKHRMRDDVNVTAADLVAQPEGTITKAGLRENIRVAIQYMESWLRGQGCVPLYNLMEDAATAEISRAQVWQWVRHGVLLDGKIKMTPELLRRVVAEEMVGLREALGASRFSSGAFAPAQALFLELCLAPNFEPFLTLPAYEHLLAANAR